MKWIEILRTPFIWVYNNIEPIETSQMADIGKNIDFTINPATGLPMMGAVDIQGNVLGTNNFNSHHDWYNDYSHTHSSFLSSYDDPFSNQY